MQVNPAANSIYDIFIKTSTKKKYVWESMNTER